MLIRISSSLLTTVTICLEGGLEDTATYIETLQENKRRNSEGKLQPVFSLTVQNRNNFTLWSFFWKYTLHIFSVPIIPHFDCLLITNDISRCWGAALGTTEQPQPWHYAGTHGAVGQQPLKKSWGTNESCYQQTTELSAGTAQSLPQWLLLGRHNIKATDFFYSRCRIRLLLRNPELNSIWQVI